MSKVQGMADYISATRRAGDSAPYQRAGRRQSADLLERIRETVESRGLFRRGQAILVAVSGGLDSTVLLHVLQRLAPINKCQLTVAHLNHRLRGRSSDADEHLVRKMCKKFALPLFVERADVRQLAKQQKISIEMAARKARHDFLARIAAKRQISTIALAHHADDQVELLFIRLLRGAGGEGLAGMKWRSRFPGAKRVEIIRPLMGETKATLREYAAANKIKFRDDATNASLDILRNRIRHELIPLLKRNYQPALSNVVLRAMEIVGAEADLARETAEDWLRLARKAKGGNQLFSDLPVAVQRRCLELQLVAEQILPDFELIEKLRLKPDADVSVGHQDSCVRCIFRDRAGFVHWREFEPIRFKSESRKLSLGKSSGQATFNGVGIVWRIEGKPGMDLPKRQAGIEYFDAELVGARIFVRHWRKGDRFQPIGMPCPVKLQDLFVNQKVPRPLRHQVVVAESEKGDIFWVEGLRISERFQLTKATKRRLQWHWRRD